MRKKILFVMFMSLTATLISTVAVFIFMNHKARLRSFSEQQETLRRFAVSTVELALSSGRIGVVTKTLEQLKDYSIVNRVIVCDIKKTPIVKIPKEAEFSPLIIDKLLEEGIFEQDQISYQMSPLLDQDGQRIGSLTIGFTFEPVRQEIGQEIGITVLIAIGILILALCVAGWQFAKMLKPLQEVVQGLEDVSQGAGDLTKRIKVMSYDEIGQLGRCFNTFMDKLNDIISDVAAYTVSVATSSKVISELAIQQAQSSEKQKNETGQVAVAIEQMSSAVLQMSSSSKKAAEAAGSAEDIARGGGKIVEQTLEHMQDIAITVNETIQKMEELGKHSKQINEINDVIGGIAGNTNLLAFNAAIEAAGAGQYGDRFSMVANQVRSLADRTGKETQVIAKMIEDIQFGTHEAMEIVSTEKEQVDGGVKTATEAGQSLNEIVDRATMVKDMMKNLALASSDQSATVKQVLVNIGNVAEITKVSADNAGQFARESHELSQLVENLKELVCRFKIKEEHKTSTIKEFFG